MDELLKVLSLAKPTLDIEILKNAHDLYGQGYIDSYDILIIIDELNAAFGIEITGNGFSRADFRTVNSLFELVKRFGGA